MTAVAADPAARPARWSRRRASWRSSRSASGSPCCSAPTGCSARPPTTTACTTRRRPPSCTAAGPTPTSCSCSRPAIVLAARAVRARSARSLGDPVGVVVARLVWIGIGAAGCALVAVLAGRRSLAGRARRGRVRGLLLPARLRGAQHPARAARDPPAARRAAGGGARRSPRAARRRRGARRPQRRREDLVRRARCSCSLVLARHRLRFLLGAVAAAALVAAPFLIRGARGDGAAGAARPARPAAAAGRTRSRAGSSCSPARGTWAAPTDVPRRGRARRSRSWSRCSSSPPRSSPGRSPIGRRAVAAARRDHRRAAREPVVLRPLRRVHGAVDRRSCSASRRGRVRRAAPRPGPRRRRRPRC